MAFRNSDVAIGAVAITPGTTMLNLMGFSVGVAGNVTVTDGLGVSTVIAAVAGVQIFMQVTQITAATATGVVGYKAA